MNILNTNNFNEIVKQIKNIKEGPLVIQAQNEDFDRKVLEYGKFQTLLSPESSAGKNKIRQTDSGLNHVTAKIAAKNNISIGINLNEIKNLEKKEKAERLAKIKQNIKICRKAKTKLAILGASEQESRELLLSLDASTHQTKEVIIYDVKVFHKPHTLMCGTL